MSPVPCPLSTMILCLLKLMKHTVIWSLLLYWRHLTWLGKLFLQDIFGVVFEYFWWTNRVWQWQIDDFWWFWNEIIKLSETQSHMRPGVVLGHLTWLGELTFRKFLMGVVFKTHFTQNMHDTGAVWRGWFVLQKLGNYQNCKWIFACQMLLKSYIGNKYILYTTLFHQHMW